MSKAYWNKGLRVDLSSGDVREEGISEEACRRLLGGIGFAADLILREVGREVHPLEPDNRLVFAVGPLQATRITGSGKWLVASKSPLTGILGFAAASAEWGVMLKKAGHEMLIIQGAATKPVYLWIDDGKVEIKDASGIWGMDAYETWDRIKEDLGAPKVSVACIGPSGEKKVAIANIVADKHSFAGRCGLGAVMGSKNLKAIAVRGTKEVEVAHPQDVEELRREINRRVAQEASALREYGTAGEIPKVNKQGDWPVKYWTGDHFDEGAEKLSGVRYKEELKAKPEACANCVLACHRDIEVDEPKYAVKGAGPEYEALGMLGSCNLVSNLKAVAKANDLCNRYGLDVISTGAFIGFATECYEKGLITKDLAGGLELKWGDGDLLVELVKQIGEKRGLGELFSKGILHAADEIGGEAKEIAVHVKGLDFPAHDPRAFFSWAISYATGPRGACHTHGLAAYAAQGVLLPEAGIDEEPDRHDMEGKEKIAAAFHDLSALDDSLVVCNFQHFGGMTLTDMLLSLNAVTGWELSMEEFLTIGRRISTLKRCINVRYGVSREDDKLPKRMFQPAKEAPKDKEPWGGRVGKVPAPFEPTLERYYELRGWDNEGVPMRLTLEELGIPEAAKE